MTAQNHTEVVSQIQNNQNQFIQFIHERLGIILPAHQVSKLHKTILEACDTFQCSPSDYLTMLYDSDDRSKALEHLIAGITSIETHFFRDQIQFRLLKDTLLPDLITIKRQKKDLSLRIWSAGCASGEEIYTVAILLNELLPDIDNWNIQLLGTDINAHALQKAIEGKYGLWSMRAISDYFKNKYFIAENKEFYIVSELKKLVKFDYLNLNDEQFSTAFNAEKAQDLILCRNVLIYFDEAKIVSLMQKLSISLAPGGYLMLGAADPLNYKMTDLIFLPNKGLIFARPTSVPAAILLDTKKINTSPEIAIKSKKRKLSSHSES